MRSNFASCFGGFHSADPSTKNHVRGVLASTLLTMATKAEPYRAMTAAGLGSALAGEPSEATRRRLVLEFLEEYRWEPVDKRGQLLSQRPAPTGDRHYDALLAALGEHLAYHDELPVPDWVHEPDRYLEQWWFPVDLPSVRADALVHSPAAFRIRGIFIGSGALERA